MNDIYGIRIIVDDSINYEDIQKLIDFEYPNLKCILSKKGEYEATHIYFSNDNYSYEWELQIWNKGKAKTNIESHKKYKQGYTKWEDEVGGGDL